MTLTIMKGMDFQMSKGYRKYFVVKHNIKTDNQSRQYNAKPNIRCRKRYHLRRTTKKHVGYIAYKMPDGKGI